MTTFLDQVREQKREEVALRSQQISENELWQQVESLPAPASFLQALQRSPGAPLSLIAEVKSKAPGRQNVGALNIVEVVHEYEASGAKAISVLTDTEHFGGSLETLSFVSRLTSLPLLHKEFIVTPYQLLEGRIRGASAALILAYYFTPYELQEIVAQAHEAGLEAVVECSLWEELPRTLEINPDILLINNRPIAAIPAHPQTTYDQGRVEVSVEWWERSEALRAWKSQPGKLLISASCLSERAHLRLLEPLPYDAVLIGNAAMSAPDRVRFLQSLLHDSPSSLAPKARTL